MRHIQILCLLALFMQGCILPYKEIPPTITVTATTNVMPQIIRWSDFGDYNDIGDLWLLEAKKRFKDPIIFVCHGGSDWEVLALGPATLGQWVWSAGPISPRIPVPMKCVAAVLRNMYPNRPIILIACNPGFYDLDLPNVWYAKGSIWAIPDEWANGLRYHEKHRIPPTKETVETQMIGSIWEFISCGSVLKPTSKPSSPTTGPTTQPHTCRTGS